MREHGLRVEAHMATRAWPCHPTGISSNLDMFLDSGYTAAVMSNYDRGAHPMNSKIRELIAAHR